MNDIRNITELIVRQAQEKATNKMQDARIKNEKNYENSLSKMKLEYNQRMLQMQEWVNKDYYAAYMQKESTANKELANHKQSLVNRVFMQAQKTMEQWSADEFLQFFEDVLEQLELEGEYIITFGELTASKIDKRALKLKYAWSHFTKSKFHLKFSDATIPNQGGFLMEQIPVEYDFLYSTLIKDIKEQMGAVVLKQLFA